MSPLVYNMERHLRVIHHVVAMLTIECCGYGGRLGDLETLSAQGAYLSPECSDAIDLRNDARELRRIADRMDQVRNSLVVNAPKPFMQKAG